jgi:nitroreductase
MTEHARAVHHFQERPLSALDAIFMRRSVRTYSAQPLDEATIRGLLDAAVQAPTAMHTEPWAFVIVQDQATLKRISDRAKGSWIEAAGHYRDLHVGVDAPLASVFATRFASPDFCVFYDASTLIAIGARPLGPFVAADCWLAAENLMLAACALGLGACCVGAAVPALNSPDTKAELGIPTGVEIVAPIIVGVSREEPRDAFRKTPMIVSWTKSS